MLKISHVAITKFAAVANNAGASAIFKLLQARPVLLQKRIKRPSSAAAAAAANAAGAAATTTTTTLNDDDGSPADAIGAALQVVSYKDIDSSIIMPAVARRTAEGPMFTTCSNIAVIYCRDKEGPSCAGRSNTLRPKKRGQYL